jgi:hypothetical protein
MQVTGGIQNKPELVYPDDGWSWPDLNKPLTTVVRVENNKYVAEKSELKMDKAPDHVIEGLSIQSEQEKLNGIYLEGCKDYTIHDSKIEMSGIGEDDFAGIGAGILANKESEVTLENLEIHMSGAARSCTEVTGASKAVIRNCKLVADGGPLPEGYTPTIGMGMLEPPAALEIGGTSRCHLSMDKSNTYFYDSTIEAAGWAGLSTDAGNGYVYLEANNCDVTIKGKGYGAYSDGDCHVVLNDCRFNTASHTAILAGECDLTWNNCTAVSGKYAAMIHDVMGIDTEIAQLFVRGGSFEVGEEFLLLRSCNTYVDMVGAKIHSKTGVLARAILNPDECATKVGEKDVFGNNLILTAMQAEGDFLNEDTDRSMKVTLSATTLKGAVVNAYLTMDNASKWTATGDSTVVLVGAIRASQIDAPAGVTITAEAGEGCTLSGEFKLASGGVLTVA